jgi:diguanylate cyclase (GGDEF)-like protein/PAS domain S-box-containing protein
MTDKSIGSKAQPLHVPAASIHRQSVNARFNEILVGAAVFGVASISFWLMPSPNGIALFWPGAAIAAALLIRSPQLRWSIAVPALLLATFLANVLVGRQSWLTGALFALINGAESGLMVATFRLLLPFPYPNISINQAAIMTALFGVAIPALAATAAGLMFHHYFSVSFSRTMMSLWSSHAMGACLIGPPIILFSFKELRRLTQGRFLAENAVIFLLGLLGCYLAIRYIRFPFVSIALLLLIASFRLGGFGTSLLSVCFGVLMTNLWLLGVRPLGLDATSSSGVSLAEVPVVALLASLMPPIAVGLGSDARRAAVRALRASERHFRESMERSPIGTLIAALTGEWSYTNIALQKMLGYSAEEFRALPAGGPSRPEEWMESETRWRQLLTGEVEFYDITRRFQHKDGRWIWTHVSVSLLRDADGSPLNMIAQIESLEARQRAEERLANERERLKITLASINDAVITTDAHTCITYLNVAAEALLGLNLKAVVTRRVDEIIHLVDPQSSKSAPNLMAQSALHGKVFTREHPCMLHRPDGSVCFVTDTVSPVLDSTGSLSSLVIVLRDSTLDVQRARDLQYRAMHDPLTGLSNRTEFERQLSIVFRSARHLNRPAAVIAIDLDRFKSVNDTAGHAAGDAMLRRVAEACRATVRSSDTVARLGGDEFVVILDNCGEERATLLGNQLLKVLNPLELDWLGSRYSIGASVGLASYTTQMLDEKTWLRAADEACYSAKRKGRGQLIVAAPAQDIVQPALGYKS